MVDDDFATVGGDHYNVVFDYATMGDGCFNMVVDMRHRGRRLPRRTTPPRPAAWTTTVPATCRPSAAAVVFDNYATTAGCLDNYSAQLRHHGRLLGQLQCRLRVGRRRRRWCSTTTPLPPPSTAGRPAACTATRPPQRRQPQQRPVRPRVHRSGGNHNNAHHSHSAVNGGRYNTATAKTALAPSRATPCTAALPRSEAAPTPRSGSWSSNGRIDYLTSGGGYISLGVRRHGRRRPLQRQLVHRLLCNRRVQRLHHGASTVYGSLAPLPWARRVVDGAVGHVAFRSIALAGPG